MPSAPEAEQAPIRFARAFLAATASWSTHSSEDSELEQSIDFLVEAIRAASRNGVVTVCTEAGAPLIEGTVPDRIDSAMAAAAALLRERDLLRVTFVGGVRRSAVRSLLQLLAQGEAARRDRGGLARIWAAEGHPSIVLEQTDSVSLDEQSARADRLQQDLPSELPEWMNTLGQASIRTLSILLLIDLLSLERDADRAADVAGEIEVLAEDLLLAGAYDDAKPVVRALASRVLDRGAPGALACRAALERLRDSAAMREAAASIDDVDAQTATQIRILMDCLAPLNSVASGLVNHPSVQRVDPEIAGTRATVTLDVSSNDDECHSTFQNSPFATREKRQANCRSVFF